MRPITKRESRGLAILLLLLCIAVIQLVVIGPILGGFSVRAAERASLKQQYRINERLSAMIPRLRHQAEQQKHELGFYTLAAPNKAVAKRLLHERVQKTIEALGGELRSMEEVTGNDEFARLRASCRMTLAELTGLLTQLQNQPPYLAISNLAVNSDQALITRKLEPLDVTLEVSVPTSRSAAR